MDDNEKNLQKRESFESPLMTISDYASNLQKNQNQLKTIDDILESRMMKNDKLEKIEKEEREAQIYYTASYWG